MPYLPIYLHINCLLANSIVPIADALTKKIGLSLPGNDKVKRVGALLEFETIKSATGVLVSTVAAGMTFNATGFTLAMIQKEINVRN